MSGMKLFIYSSTDPLKSRSISQLQWCSVLTVHTDHLPSAPPPALSAMLAAAGSAQARATPALGFARWRGRPGTRQRPCSPAAPSRRRFGPGLRSVLAPPAFGVAAERAAAADRTRRRMAAVLRFGPLGRRRRQARGA